MENSADFDFKIKLPFFGWINKKCLPGTKFDLPRCECIVNSIVRIGKFYKKNSLKYVGTLFLSVLKSVR